MDVLTDETDLSSVRLPLTPGLREYLRDHTGGAAVWSRLGGLAAGVLLWLVAFAIGNAAYFVLGTLLVVGGFVLAGTRAVERDGARRDLDAGVFLKSRGWVEIVADDGDADGPDFCAVDIGDRRLPMHVSARDARDIAKALREQPIFADPDASPTTMRVWAEVLWLPHLGRLLALRDGAGRVVYRDDWFDGCVP